MHDALNESQTTLYPDAFAPRMAKITKPNSVTGPIERCRSDVCEAPCWAWTLLAGLIVALTMVTQPSSAREKGDDALAGDSQLPWLRTTTRGHSGTVRAICFTPDSRQLCTAGFDKTVKLWTVEDTKPTLDGSPPVLSGTDVGSIQWEIGPGPLGQVYAMAVAPDPPRLAIAGFGNRTSEGGGGGDIVMADPMSRKLMDFENDGKTGHKQTVAGLAFSADGKWLASHSLNGQVLLRRKAGDEHKIPLATASAKEKLLKFAPVAIVGNDLVAFPVLVPGKGSAVKLYSIAAKTAWQLNEVMEAQITALAASPDGRYLAGADVNGNLRLWEIRSGAVIKTVSLQKREGKPRRIVVSLSFGPDGNRLIAGTADLRRYGDRPELLEWNLSSSQTAVTRTVTKNPVWACAISPDGRWVAYADGSNVYLESASPKEADPSPLVWGHQGIEKVGFVPGKPDYSVVWNNDVDASSGRDRDEQRPETQTFDPANGKLSPSQDAIPSVANPPGWRWDSGPPPAGKRGLQLLVTREGRQDLRILMELDSNGADLHGTITSYAWTTGQTGKPTHLVLGTAGALGCLFVFDLTDGTLLRAFVGHSGAVNSVAVSPDNRYLVSGSDDGTIRYWPLPGGTPSDLWRRWGIELEKTARRELVVRQILDTGPLYYRGMRQGDVIAKIAWNDQGENIKTVSDPDEIIKQLEELVWMKQVVFSTTRSGLPREDFQEFPAWKHILAVFPSGSDWIAWNPVGYYNCSANGLRLIGWQVNNEREVAPDFYDAEQFYQTFKQPALIDALLAEGSLEQARRSAGLDDPQEELSISNPADIQPPRVTIIEPAIASNQSDPAAAETDEERFMFKGLANVRVTEPTFHIKAVAEANSPRFPLTAIKLQHNGRNPEGARHAVRAKEAMAKTADWDIQLTPGINTIRILADTAASQGKSEELVVWYEQGDRPTPRPSLYVLAIGISKYPGNRGIQPLKYAHSDAEELARTMESYSQELFTAVEVVRLTDAEATRGRILEEFEKLTRRARLGDTAMIFYSGHGVRDENGDFFLVSHDGRIDDISNTCVPGAAITEFLQNTLAKVVLLIDACHSGAVQLDFLVEESNRSDYGSGDGVFVMVSSQGEELSIEHEDWGAGAFTKALTDGLRGDADEGLGKYPPDGQVLNDEINRYVRGVVPMLTRKFGYSQTPLATEFSRSRQRFVIPFPLSKVRQ